MKKEDITIGQVYRSKINVQKYVVVAVSKSLSKVFLSGVIDEVDSEWSMDYLLNTCEIDRQYVH